MNTIAIAISFAAGIGLGLIHFGGLLVTIHWLKQTDHAAMLLLSSFLVRSAVLLVGFYFVMNHQWANLVACMFGVLLSRVMFVRLLSFEEGAGRSRIAG